MMYQDHHAGRDKLHGMLKQLLRGLPLLLALTTGLAAPSGTPWGAGDHRVELRLDGRVRFAWVHVPPGLPAGRAVPLVLALHGGGGHAAHMADDAHYGLPSAADRAGWIIAFPNGHSRWPGGRLATWNAGHCCGEARDQGVDDVAFLRALVAELRTHLDIDPGRVFAMGMSNGGMMSHRLACEAPDLFRAVASVAGTDNTRDCAPRLPVSVLHIHARDDDHVLFNGGAGPGAFRDERKVTAFTSVPETMQRWQQRDQCHGPARTVLDQPGARCEAATDCAGGSVVQWCVTDSGGHSWPGAPASRLGKATPSQALSANALIWDFFRAQSAAP